MFVCHPDVIRLDLQFWVLKQLTALVGIVYVHQREMVAFRYSQ